MLFRCRQPQFLHQRQTHFETIRPGRLENTYPGKPHFYENGSGAGRLPYPYFLGELYSALQQGVVDGAENNPPSFYLSRHYEVCKYYSLDEHTSVPDVLLISTKIWTDLDPDQQTILQEAADKALQLQKELWKKSSNNALKQVQQAGIEIFYPVKTAFTDQVAPLMEEYKKDPRLAGLIQRIQTIE